MIPHGREGFYVAENGTHAWYDVGRAIAQVLHDRGLGGSPEPTTFSAAELVEHFVSEVSGFLSWLVGGFCSLWRAGERQLLGW